MSFFVSAHHYAYSSVYPGIRAYDLMIACTRPGGRNPLLKLTDAALAPFQLKPEIICTLHGIPAHVLSITVDQT
jgi:hypothetical protein